MSESSDNSNDPAPSVILSSRLNVNIRSSMLRPSLFGSKLCSNSTETDLTNEEKEGSKINPFLAINNDKTSEEKTMNSGEIKEQIREETTDPLSLLSKNGLPKSNLLVAAAKASIPLSEGSFVFGQNVHERVTGENVLNIQTTADTTKTESDNSNMSTSSASNLLFSSAIQNTKGNDKNESEKSHLEVERKSLTEVARAYEESRAQKRKYEEVETFTGEENEVNVTDINCKLFAFVNANWEERGRGSLRLNDCKGEDYSRLVFRTSGNLRVLVNTKIWPGMVAEKPGPKSLRLTAIDNSGQIKIFLVMSRPDDINTLFSGLSKRISECKKKNPVGHNEENGTKKDTASNDGQGDLSEPSTKKSAVELI